MGTIIAGFGSNDRVPGMYGEVVFGSGVQDAASIPLAVLLVGLKTSGGSITNDTQVQQIFSASDADAYAGAGSELACMAYDAIAAAPTVPTFILAPTAAGGAVAATDVLALAGTWSTSGQLTVRIAGKPVSITVGATDTPSTVATNIASAINGANVGRLPISATASTANVTLACKTAGIRGNQHVIFVDTSQAPSGLTATLTGSTWQATTAYTTTSYVTPVTANGYYYKCTVGGNSGASQPTWPTTINTTVTDGTVTWTCWGKVVTGGGVTLGGGAGVETLTNALSTILTQQYDRMALAQNDATSLAAWKSQIDTQAGAPSNILQHAVVASNDTLTSATAIAQTTLNDPRFQVLWCLNGETHPSRMAASFAALRAATEQQDPCAAYNNSIVPGAAAMSQRADWPSHSTLVSAINNSVTPITSTGDGYARVVRSITTKSLTGGNPDYSTLDTSQASVPDFVFRDLKALWVSDFAVSNPRVQDNPKPNERTPPSGVAYPDLWSARVLNKLVDYSKGIISGTSPSIAPILISVVQPVSNFDNVAKRIMSTVVVTPAYNDAQIGVSVRQSA